MPKTKNWTVAMTPFLNSVINDNIFFISSENYQSIKSRFYGYAYHNGQFMLRMKEDDKPVDQWAAGYFCDLVVTHDRIEIRQDYFCTFGLYVYRKDNFWAISNSLYYLVYNLGDKALLSINHDFECMLLRQGQVSAVNETIFNEITELFPDEFIIIDKQDGSLFIVKGNRPLYCIHPFSEDGVYLVDSWHDRWHNLYKSLVMDGHELICDLSGGMDSRLAATCYFNLDFDRPNLTLYSADSFNKEDLPIATRVGKIINLPLSQKLPEKEFFLSGEEQLHISMLTKFGFHDQLCTPINWSPRPIFHCTGAVGKRGAGMESASEIIATAAKAPPLGGYALAPSLRRMLENVFRKISERFPEDISDARKLYNYTRIKCHAGRTALEGFMTNEIPLTPFFDPQLFRLKITRSIAPDIEIFTAFAITRWLPALKRMPFDNNRSIAEDTWRQAEELNAKFPYKADYYARPAQLLLGNISAPRQSSPGNGSSMHNHMLESFKSREMRGFVTRQFSRQVYDWGMNFTFVTGIFGNCAITRLYMLYRAYQLAGQLSETEGREDTPDCAYLPDGIAPDFIKTLNAVRINCVPIGNENGKIEVLGTSDPDFIYFAQPWGIRNHGTGIIAHVFKREAEITLRVNDASKIQLSMSGTSRIIREYAASSTRHPQFAIDFKYIIILNKKDMSCMHASNNLWGIKYSKAFKLDLDVKPGDEILVRIRYEPHSYSKKEFMELVEDAWS